MYDNGWSVYPDAGTAMGSLIGQLAGLAYNPSLADVGHGTSYNPGSVIHDAAALNFLGFFPDVIMAQMPDSFGQGGMKDLAAQVGAFFPPFKVAVTDFQQSAGITADGFIGPQTRTVLKQAVDAKNAREPGSPVVPGAPAPSGTAPNALAPAGMSTGLLAAIALAVVGGGYAVYKYVL